MSRRACACISCGEDAYRKDRTAYSVFGGVVCFDCYNFQRPCLKAVEAKLALARARSEVIEFKRPAETYGVWLYMLHKNWGDEISVGAMQTLQKGLQRDV